jgi:ribosomal protein L7/L12
VYADDADFEAELRALLADGRKIEAIKRYREQTGAGLGAAKEAVEAIEQGGSLPTFEPLDTSTETEIASLLATGQKIRAVKLYRERTGAGLKEAKDAVEAIGRGEKVVLAFREIDQEVESQLIGLLQQGQKIQAIKVCRARTGMGLKEAKDTVEGLAAKHGLAVAKGGGCLGAVILVLLVIVAGVAAASEARVATNTSSTTAAPVTRNLRMAIRNWTQGKHDNNADIKTIGSMPDKDSSKNNCHIRK